MNKRIKQFLIPLSLTMTMGSLSACGVGKRINPYSVDLNVDVRGTTINFWAGFGSDISDVLEEILSEFTAKTGVKVNYESKSNYDSCLKAVTLAASSGKYPHLVVGYPDHFASYVKSDIIVRLDYYLENDVHNDTFEPAGENFSIDDFYSDYVQENKSIEFDKQGNPYTLGVPFNKSTEVLTYNKTFFDWCATQNDLKDSIFVPRTYQEVESVGLAILNLFETRNVYGKTLYKDGTTTKGSQGDKDVVIDLTGVTKPDSTNQTTQFKPFAYDSQANFFITTVRQNGGTYTEYDKNAKKGYLAFNSSETVDGLTYLKHLYDEKVLAIPADFGEEKYGSTPFKGCQCVMMVGSSAGVANAAPSGNKFKIAAAPVPYKTADKKFVISQGANLALLDVGSEVQRVASWQLLKFLTKYANGAFCAATGYYPSCPYAEKAGDNGVSGMWEGYSEDDFTDYSTWLQDSLDSLNQTDNMRAQTAQVNLDSYVDEASNWTKFVDQPFSGSADVRTAVAAIVPWVLTGEKTPQQAIDTIYAQLSDYVRK